MFTLDSRLADDSRVLGDFPLSRLLLLRDAQHPWFVLVPRRPGVSELYQLNESDREQFFRESLELGEQLMAAFDGDKLNVAALGNLVPQLHVHHIVRYRSDPAWPGPVWGAGPMRDYDSEGLERTLSRFADCRLTGFEPLK
ncbi:MAG: HIT domain-containing protein [Pseudomonadota bacterium]